MTEPPVIQQTAPRKDHLPVLTVVTIVLQCLAALFFPTSSGSHHHTPQHPISLFWFIIQEIALLLPFIWGMYLLGSHRTPPQRILAYLAIAVSFFWLVFAALDAIYTLNIGAQWKSI
jgi:hypothetical protein